MLRGPEMTPEHGSTDVTVSAIGSKVEEAPHSSLQREQRQCCSQDVDLHLHGLGCRQGSASRHARS